MLYNFQVILCEESFHGVSKFDFVIRLARPTLVFNTNAVLALYSGWPFFSPTDILSSFSTKKNPHWILLLSAFF